ncbi:hypothetical protein AUQ37_01050 [Candidatus Methanomethylophilus sp. 1R26]|nr:hypothetical protein [Candidatus Methanomethylophilus sp. 1R26]KUE73926.1 hypothetical protein AUQ37_01050 [Candidatus Methanomethylophilus sp. 1R26]TQS76768.1 MAG: hypothetical protein A3Q59_02530 [Methanomethylophilus alvi]
MSAGSRTMLSPADTVRMIIDLFPAPSERSSPDTTPFMMMAPARAMNGKAYSLHPSRTSSAPMNEMIGSRMTQTTAVVAAEAISPRMTAFSASSEARRISSFPMRKEMHAEAPTPRPTPIPAMSQYTGAIIESADRSSSPSPEAQAVSTKRFTWMTR